MSDFHFQFSLGLQKGGYWFGGSLDFKGISGIFHKNFEAYHGLSWGFQEESKGVYRGYSGYLDCFQGRVKGFQSDVRGRYFRV